MDIAVIEFTLQQLIDTILTICGLITAVAAVVGIIAVVVKKAKTPNITQNERLDAVEERLDKHDKLLSNDLERLQNIEAGNRVTQKAILALLRHGIDGNDIESMRHAEKDLQEYLIEK